MSRSRVRNIVTLSAAILIAGLFAVAPVNDSPQASAGPPAHALAKPCNPNKPGCQTTTTTTTAPTTTTTTTPGGTVSPPQSIAANCTVDVADALTNWIATVPNGSTIAFPTGACYRTDRTVWVQNKTGLTFQGAATFQRFAQGTVVNGVQHIFVLDSSNITIRDLTIRGTNTVSDIDPTTPRGLTSFEPSRFGSNCGSYCFETGLQFQNTNGITVSGITVDAVWGDGLLFGGEHAGDMVRNVLVQNVTVDRNGRQGITIATADGVRIENARLLHSWATGYDLEVNALDGSTRNVEIIGGYINAWGLAVSACGQGASNVRVEGVYVKRSLESWPWLTICGNLDVPQTNWTVVNNVSEWARGGAESLYFDGVTGITVTGNVSPGQGNVAVRVLDGGGTVTVQGNDFRGHSSVANITGSGICGNRIVAGGAFNSPTTCAAGNIYTVPTFINSTCATDVTAALNAWVASVPNGTAAAPNTLRFSAGACYRVDGTLGAAYGTTNPAGYHRSYLVFDGQQATIDGSFFLPPVLTNRAGISLIASDHVTVQGFTIKGNHPNPCNLSGTGACQDGGYNSQREWQHGVAVFGSSFITVQGNTILNVYGDGVTLAQDPQTTDSIVRFNTIDGTGRMGVALTSNNRITIQSNIFDRISYHVVDIEAEIPGTQVSNITFQDNTIKRHYFAVIGSGSGECVERSGINIIGNVMENAGVTTYPALFLSGPDGCSIPMRDVVVSGNTLRRTDTSAGPPFWHNATIQIRNTEDASVTNNRIIQSRTDTGAVAFFNATGVLNVSNNDMREINFVYSRDGVEHGPGVTSCGNTTLAGPNQPVAC